jgi:hypothetical protein
MRVLVDAGLSARELERRLVQGRSIPRRSRPCFSRTSTETASGALTFGARWSSPISDSGHG